MKICCPPALVKDIGQNFAQEPRFPDKSGKAREVEDLTRECKKWKRYGACELDRDFNISSSDLFFKVSSKEMFDFMLKACSGACGWAKGNCSSLSTELPINIDKSNNYQDVLMSTPGVRTGLGMGCVSRMECSWLTPAGRAVESVASCRQQIW